MRALRHHAEVWLQVVQSLRRWRCCEPCRALRRIEMPRRYRGRLRARTPRTHVGTDAVGAGYSHRVTSASRFRNSRQTLPRSNAGPCERLQRAVTLVVQLSKKLSKKLRDGEPATTSGAVASCEQAATTLMWRAARGLVTSAQRTPALCTLAHPRGDPVARHRATPTLLTVRAYPSQLTHVGTEPNRRRAPTSVRKRIAGAHPRGYGSRSQPRTQVVRKLGPPTRTHVGTEAERRRASTCVWKQIARRAPTWVQMP
jgi:hypothetical protein